MTWRELFRRAWLVLRLRFKRFRVCEKCGDVMRIGPYCELERWVCPSCEEFRRLEHPLTHDVIFNQPIGAPIRMSAPGAIKSAIDEMVILKSMS